MNCYTDGTKEGAKNWGTITQIDNDPEKAFVMTIYRSTKYCYYRPQENMATILLFQKEVRIR